MLTEFHSALGTLYWVSEGPEAVWEVREKLDPKFLRAAAVLAPSIKLETVTVWPSFQKVSTRVNLNPYRAYTCTLVLQTNSPRTAPLGVQIETISRMLKGDLREVIKIWRFYEETEMLDFLGDMQSVWQRLTMTTPKD
jgi:hypothetical protein